jgi:uncharacterized glyoxalase superfamily protein PhnB
MAEKVVPMIHVPNVRATVDWYQDIGFTVIDTYSDDGEGLSFAMVSFGSSEVMFSEGGQSSSSERREVDLYVYSDNVDDLYERLKDRVEVVEGLHDTFYGMREFIIRDLNRFWITYGQPSVFEVLLTGVREGNTEVVRAALNRGGLKPETLTAALAAAATGEIKNMEIIKMLEDAGAIPPPQVAADVLQSYAGKYKGEKGLEVIVTFQNGELFATPAGQKPLSLLAVDRTTFRPAAFDGVTISFNVEAGKAIGFELKQAQDKTQLQRIES